MNDSFDKPVSSIEELAKANTDSIFKLYQSSINGLSEDNARARLHKFGLNQIAKSEQDSDFARFFANFKNPLIILLVVLVVVSFLIKEIETAIIITIMIFISILLTFFQESRSNKAAQKLQEMVKITSTVIRIIDGKPQAVDVPTSQLVAGDMVSLTTGNIIPADIKIVSSNNLYVNQSALTGESLPVEKYPDLKEAKTTLELTNILFMGSYVSSGTATGIVVKTGSDTYFGSLADTLIKRKAETAFEKGVSDFTWLMIRFMFISAPLVFIINGVSKGNWLQALLFALAVTVALTPEMLPMILTVNLAKGALQLSKHKVIIKQLSAIQNLGAMNILCSDKTGTLTQNRVILERHLDINEQENEEILKYVFINSYFQTGLKNLLDEAVFDHIEPEVAEYIKSEYKKLGEIPFDFSRKRLSVIVETKSRVNLLVCKGAIEEVLSCTTRAMDLSSNTILNLSEHRLGELKNIAVKLNNDGFRVLAVAYKEILNNKENFSEDDESNLILLGFAAFLDPPKESVTEAISELNSYGVEIKVLTGDNELVTQKICKEVGLQVKGIVLGNNIENLSEEELIHIAENNTIFAKLTPLQKEKIIDILHKKNNIVGFLGDGINDAPSLKAADVGISVNTAVDIAKESADIILLEKNLLVLVNGITEGRTVFANVMKYVYSRASLSFGNMLSLVIASSFLPFLPMLPIQIIAANLLADFSNTSLPVDNVDKEVLFKPKLWEVKSLKKIMIGLGLIVSLSDFILFLILIKVFNCWTNPVLFQTGWFIEFVLLQILMIYVVRTNKISFVNSQPSPYLILSHISIAALGMFLPFSFLSGYLGFTQPPKLYYLLLLLVLAYFLIVSYLTNRQPLT